MSCCEPKFCQCDNCKVMVEVICCEDNDKFECCGTPMKEMVPNTSEGAHEKHLPVIEKNGNRITVKVGSVFLPMSEQHSIEWVYLKTERGGQRVNLKPSDEPVAEFIVAEGDRPVAAYAFCNLHGFWKTDIK